MLFSNSCLFLAFILENVTFLWDRSKLTYDMSTICNNLYIPHIDPFNLHNFHFLKEFIYFTRYIQYNNYVTHTTNNINKFKKYLDCNYC